jgi:acyl carrier protein
VAQGGGALAPLPGGSLTPQTRLADLAADSLDLVELVLDLEEEFGVSFAQADLRTVHTLGDLAALLRRRNHAAPG